MEQENNSALWSGITRCVCGGGGGERGEGQHEDLIELSSLFIPQRTRGWNVMQSDSTRMEKGLTMSSGSTVK